MSMVLPKLWAKSPLTTIVTRKHLAKYKHLIKWRNQPTIMEFGYADGGASQKSFFPYLPSDMKEFVATDISENMVEYARKNSTHPMMKFMQLDIATKQVPSQLLGRFDHIFGFLVLHLVKNPRQAFENMKSMLKEGGSFFLTFFEHVPYDEAFSRLAKHPEWGQYGHQENISPYYLSPNRRQEYERDLNEAGFRNYEFLEENGSFEFPDEAEFDDIYIAANPILPEIPEQRIEEYKKIYLTVSKNAANYSIKYRNGNPTGELKYKLFILSAWNL
ncbi:hypothetical protein JTB14_036983 [Gonioctena quinquepunctata]|nr:hypothetical protein JTB14_036983 [Gonioctena quinquepunctata]